MKTINSQQSLILFDQNRSDSNIQYIEGADTRLVLKPDYEALFSGLAEKLKTKQFTSFTKLWRNSCEEQCKAVRAKLRALILNDYKDVADIEKVVANIEKVVAKFRGNAGEIFAEAFFISGLAAEHVDPNSYVPVDPHNERFVDANAKAATDGMPVGVQIKNYNEALVSEEVFNKAAAEDCYRIRIDKLVKPEDLAAYMAAPRQVVLSFTGTIEYLASNNADVVLFLGPSFIDSKKIQGDLKLKLPARWQMLQKIADEVKEVA